MLPLRAAVAVLLLSLVSCGRTPETTAHDDTSSGSASRGALQGPPTWRASEDGLNAGEQGILVRAHATCWLTLRFKVSDGEPLPDQRRKMPSGSVVRITWSSAAVQTGVLNRTPEDIAAGRTEAQTVTMKFSINSGVATTFQVQRMTRPGVGTAHAIGALAPGRYEALSWNEPQELAAVAITDWLHGKPKLTLRHPRSRLSGQPSEPDAHDFASTAFLHLVVEPFSGS